MGNRGEKRFSCGLSCFRGSSLVADAEESDGRRSVEGQRRRSKSLVSLLRFRAKKKTAPLPVLDAVAENAVDGLIVAADDEADKILPARASNAKKKGFFKKNYKDKSISHESPTKPNKPKKLLEGPHTSPIRHLTRAQPASPLVQEPDRTNHLQTRTGYARQSNPRTSKNTTRKRGTNEKNSEAGLIVLAVTLTTMLLGGRAIAILCMSAWFYISPSLCTIAVKYKDMSSEQYKKNTVGKK